MRKQKKRLLSLTLSLAMAVTLISVPKITARAEDSGVGGFVNRCYQVALGREADAEGYADWTSQLTEGRSDGATVAYGFVFSPEYTNANKDNGAFVTDMYTLFLGRTPDEAGYNDWKGKLDAGADRMDIFYGFANSPEFFNICTDYGVTAGYFTTEFNKDQVNAVNMFVARMYRVCLGRLGDQGGQTDWTEKLLRGELTGNQCAFGFIFSQEYTNLGLSNEDYVKNLYRTFMGREYDQGGFDDWTSKLNAGFTRDEVFSGFANSSEFQNICDSYGIIRGDYAASDVHEEAEQEHGWRVTKKTYSNGQFSVYSYDDASIIPNKVVRYNADGSELGIEQMQSYDENTKSGTRIFATYDEADGTLLAYERSDFTYVEETDNGHTERHTLYDKDGVFTGYREDVYQNVLGDDSEYCVESREYNGNNELQVTWKYTYGPKGKYKSYSCYRADGSVQMRANYNLDADGNETSYSTEYYDETGAVTQSYTGSSEFNAEGKQVKGIHYWNGEYVGYDEYVYENGNMVKQICYNSDGSVTTTMTYVFDANGNEINERWTYSDQPESDFSIAYEYEWY